jgi:hypothetical protein
MEETLATHLKIIREHAGRSIRGIPLSVYEVYKLLDVIARCAPGRHDFTVQREGSVDLDFVEKLINLNLYDCEYNIRLTSPQEHVVKVSYVQMPRRDNLVKRG